jgi:anti-anti-sigma factor
MLSASHATILIVDDEPAVTKTFAAYLRKQGFQVLTAENALEAIRLCKQQTVHLTITDHHMPEISGVELIGELKQAHPEMPVVLMSGGTDMRTALSALRAHAFDFLAKPVDSQDLLRTVHRGLQHAEELASANHGEDKDDNAAIPNVEPPPGGWSGPIAHTHSPQFPDTSILLLYRSLDENAERNFALPLKRMMREGGIKRNVVLNLSSVRYINNIGLNHLAEAYKRLTAEGHSVILTDLQDQVYRYLKMLGYIDYFQVTGTVNQAFSKFGGSVAGGLQ